QTVDHSGAPTTALQNVGGADIKGVELELEGNYAGLSVVGSVGLTHFKYKDLGHAEGCQDFPDPVAAFAAGLCLNGNPGYHDIAPGSPKWTG
ncbi:hypothetical protein ABTL50_19315, partial [Acinetobacter baumannii]